MARKRFGASIGPDDEEPEFSHIGAVQGQDKSLPWLEGAPDSYDDEDERLVPRGWLMAGLAAFLLLLGTSVFLIYRHMGGTDLDDEIDAEPD